MNTAIRWTISTLLALTLYAGPVRAAEAPRCFPAQVLAAKAGEETPRRSALKVAVPKIVPGKPVAGNLRGVIRRVDLPKGEKLVALTFDLCETSAEVAGYDGAIVDTLRKEGVAATFFAGGHWLATHPERARQLMADPLFEVGNHSWSHRLLARVDDKVLRTQVLAPQAAAKAVIAEVRAACPKADAQAPTLFRFPAGVCDRAALDFVNDNGLLAVEWDVVSGDPDPRQNAAGIRQAVLSRVKPGSIVVMHANGRGHHTAEALPGLISALKARGFGFATVSDLLARGKPVIAAGCERDTPPLKRQPAAPSPAQKTTQGKPPGPEVQPQ
jgi:peptidoglycan/xylan/chitin deacetylase (PgdA/CDA1 family)